MNLFFQMTSAGQLKYYLMNTKFNISRAVSKTTETEKKGDKQTGNQSCSTLQNQQITEFKKLRESVHSLFQLAKNQLSSIYKSSVTNQQKIQKIISNQSQKFHKFEDMHKLQYYNFLQNYQIYQQFLEFQQKAHNLLQFSVMSETHILHKSLKTHHLRKNNTILKKKLMVQLPHLTPIIENKQKKQLPVKYVQISDNIKDHDNLAILQTQWPLLQNINVQAKGMTHLCEFQNVKADKLQIFNLSNNLINAYFPNLTTLNLSKNRIKNIEGLQNAKFQKLNVLNLSNNLIKKLKPLTKCAFTHLLELNLSGNSLQTVQELNGCEFKKLQILTLDDNKLTTLDSLKQSSFYRLKVLSFSNNSIKTLQFLPKIYLRKLQALLGHNNKITSIEPLKDSEIPLVKQIILHDNQISDISCLKQTKFPNLIGLDLQYNNIFAKTLCCFIINDKGCRQAAKKYPFILI